MSKKKGVVLIGYSGHAFVICDIFNSQNIDILGYCEALEKAFNPYNLMFLGKEDETLAIKEIFKNDYFIGVGKGSIRQKIMEKIVEITTKLPLNAIHKNASISKTANIGQGVMVGNGSIINACSTIGSGVICNTQSVIEHECVIGDYCHVAPGAVLCGNVQVGSKTFIGAKSVVREGVKIGKNVLIGAGTVIVKDIPDGSKVVGNPQKFI